MSKHSAGFIPTCCAVQHSKSQSASTCSRRQFLITTAFSFFSLSSSARSETTTVPAGSNSNPRDFDSLEDIQSVNSETVPLETFVTELNKGSVQQVWFFGFQNQNCFYSRPDGSILQIGEGYPKESSQSPESPLQIMAQVRNKNIPFSVHPVPRSFLRRR